VGSYAEAESSGEESPQSRLDLNYRPSPKKRANTRPSIPTVQKDKLTEKDGGCCLITRESDGLSIEACHLMRRREHEAKVSYENASLMHRRGHSSHRSKSMNLLLAWLTTRCTLIPF
jgi:hypothetical protein